MLPVLNHVGSRMIHRTNWNNIIGGSIRIKRSLVDYSPTSITGSNPELINFEQGTVLAIEAESCVESELAVIGVAAPETLDAI